MQNAKRGRSGSHFIELDPAVRLERIVRFHAFLRVVEVHKAGIAERLVDQGVLFIDQLLGNLHHHVVLWVGRKDTGIPGVLAADHDTMQFCTKSSIAPALRNT